MKYALVAIAAWFLTTGLQAMSLDGLKLNKFSSTKGNYSIAFPGKVESSERKTNSDVGEITFYTDVVELGQTAAFLVCYNDYPAAVKNADPKKLLDGVINGNKGPDGSLVKNEAITFGTAKLPGRNVVIKKPGDTYMRNLAVLQGVRLYQVMVVGNEKTVNHPKMDEFYKSFTITK